MERESRSFKEKFVLGVEENTRNLHRLFLASSAVAWLGLDFKGDSLNEQQIKGVLIFLVFSLSAAAVSGFIEDAKKPSPDK